MILKQPFARTNLMRPTHFLACGLLTAFISAPSYAENISFDGSDASTLVSDPYFIGRDSLFSTTSLSGNVITLAPAGGGSYTAPYQVYGGLGTAGQEVSNNHVQMDGGSVMRSVQGGYNSGDDNGSIGAVRNNSVVIAQGSVASDVIGGYSEVSGGASGYIEGNSVVVTGGTIGNSLYGGFLSGQGSLVGNSVTVSTNVSLSEVYGAYSNDTTNNGVSRGNWIKIEDGTIRNNIFGAYASSGDVMENYIIVTGGHLAGVTGGATTTGAAIGNYVEFSNATATDIYGAYTFTNSATNNSVVFNSGTATSLTGAGAYGGLVENNSVTVNGGSVTTLITAYNIDGVVKDNQVTINGGTIAEVYASYAAISSNGNEFMSGNKAYVTGGNITNLYGSYMTNNGFEGNAKDSQIFVSGGTIDNIYGGYMMSQTSGVGNAINNTVTLSGGVITGNIYGGYFDGNITGDLRTGNTLNLEGYRGSVSGIYNFENYNWVLPKDVVNGDVMITITGSDAVDLTGTKQTIAMVNDGNVLNIGDKVTLIDKAHGYGSQNMVVNQGFFLSYDMTVSDDDGALALVVGNKNDSTPPPVDPTEPTDPTKPVDPTNPVVPTEPTDPVKVNPTSKAFLEGRAAALAFVNQGGELIAGYGIQAAKTAVSDGSQNGLGFVPFVIANGGSSRYKTGSHVDVDGFNSVIGLATGGEVGQGHQLTLGAFFEFGRGNYDSYNSFGSYGSVHGDGDTNYTGGGVLFRMDIAGTGLGRVANLPKDVSDGLYVEGSFRGGKVDMDFDSSDLIDGEGYRGRYDSKVTYLGAHGAVGYVFNFDAKQSLDVYGRYMWTRMDGDTVLIGKDKLHFGSSESSRIRVGGRYSYQMNEQVKPYVGLAYEHEFKGDIAARAYDLKLDKPSLKGDTGVLELGVSFKPVKNKPLSIDVAAEGYAGQRQGGGGSLKLKYQF